ncbi:MAG: carboxypeptidase regulatory-like domain-containing protein [Gemmatimonadaceae bacterium]|nr:carboxypeptidase regulatory-like domain-containing protein [Gemmatimonadaceae bacterium]
MRLRHLALSWIAVLSMTFALPAGAQQLDVIRGLVTGPDSIPIAGARVTATSLSGYVNRSARTDTRGRFTITFPGGEGDYFVTVTALGFAPKRFEVKRTADQEVLLADARLSRTVAQLDEVRVIGDRPRATRDDRTPDIGGSERSVNGGNVAAGQAGDLAAMAASLPGVTMVPGAEGDPSGFSVLGLTPDQNNTTLNGQSFGGANLPRDAGIQSALATSPYDVSRGGFSGAQFQLRTSGGSNFKVRSTSLNVDAPALQYTDASARALGQEFSNLSLGGLVAGPIRPDKAFYNLSYQLGRRSNDLRTLLNTGADGLLTSGVSPDSATRLLGILSALGIPARPAGNPQVRHGDQGLLFGSINVAPPGSRTGQAFTITGNASWNRTSPVSGSVTELPSHSGERTNWNGGLAARHSAYFSSGILTETNVNLSASRNAGTSFLELPNATVRVNSALSDGTEGLRLLSFGGNPFLATSQENASTGVLNTLSWFSRSSRHRVKLTSELRRDIFRIDQTTNRFGTYSFNSLADLEAGRAVSYTRQLEPRLRSGGQVVAAMSLGDAWRRSNDLQVQYGVRVDANRFDRGPAANADIERLFGTRNTAVPNRVYVSPRVGFSWTYGTAPQIGGFDGAVRGPRAVVRGGAGVFQNTPQATLLGQALDNTGLASAVQQLGCFGAAAPVPQWGTWLTDPSTIPVLCADGLQPTSFSSIAPNVTLFDAGWNATRSLRSNLQWNGPVLRNRFNASIDLTYSRNLNQPGTFDLNFAGETGFSLAEEAGRPVFVPVASIDPATGAAAPRDSRVSQLFNVVNANRSDLRSESRQVSVRLSPSTFNTRVQWSLAYVYGNVREQYRGFQSTTGDPRAIEWSRSGFDTRHQWQYSLSYNAFNTVRLAWFGSIRSGSPYTPVVGGDVNGDGLQNDRAFVFAPSTGGQLAADMGALLAGAGADARDCLTRQLGTLAARNSCRGAWTQNAFLSLSFNPLKLRLPQRATLSLQVSNPLGAADLLLHGSGKLRGWGQPAQPDATLLYVRGFDPGTRTFRYEVNQRFGATRPAVTTFRAPVTVTALMRFDLGPSRERQVLTQQLDRGRRTPGQKAPEPQLQAMYGGGGVTINPMAQILRQSDSLQLTALQADSIATMNRSYTIRLSQIWAPVVREFARLDDRYDHDIAFGQYKRAREASIDALRVLAPAVRGLLTADQRRRLPTLVASHLDLRYLASIRSGTVGGSEFGGGFMGGGMNIPQGGGGQTIIIR